VWAPAEAGVPAQPLSPLSAVEEVATLDSVDRVLPELIARSSAARSPLSLVLVRPGRPGSDEPAPAGGIADLAAALTVSLAPDQQLLSAGHGQLAVVVPGGPGTARRHATRLMQRAALAGAPMLTWAMASCPRDGSSSIALMQSAIGRLQLPAGKPKAAALLGRGALWVGAAAAGLVGVLAYTLGSGHGAHPSASAVDTSNGSAGLSTTAGGGSGGAAGGGQGTAAQPNAAPSWLGGSQAGTSGSSTGGDGGSGAASTPAGPGSSSTGAAPADQVGQQQSTGIGSTGTTIPGVTGTTIPGVTGTTIPGVTTTTVSGGAGGTTGSGTTGGTTGSGTSGTTSGTNTAGTGSTGNQCTGLLQSLLCTVNGLLG
jgi:hypothetical protein